MRFEGKSVVVTGASSGMGWDIAKSFAAEGATVIAVARRQNLLEDLAKEAEGLPGKILPFPGDVSLQEVNEKMIDYAVEVCGKLDVLVNNAGIMDDFIPIGDLSNEKMETVLKLNLEGPMYAMRKAVQVMQAQGTGGSIVNIGSIAGVHGCRAGAAYTASKYALVGLTKNTAHMYTKDHIRCNVLCPGGVKTNMNANQNHGGGYIHPLGMERVMKTRDVTIAPGTPHEISEGVLYLASDEARFVNGIEFIMDGGLSCN